MQGKRQLNRIFNVLRDSNHESKCLYEENIFQEIAQNKDIFRKVKINSGLHLHLMIHQRLS
jgi:hypothetical protein